MFTVHRLSSIVFLTLLAACGTDLPRGTESITVGRVVVRTDSVLDFIGVVFRVSDTAQVPPRGPARHWLQDLAAERSAGAFQAASAAGAIPVSMLLDTWSTGGVADSVCGLVAPGQRRCFGGNAPMRRRMMAFIDSARAYAPRLATFDLDGLDAASRRRDLADVHTALTAGRSLDSSVIEWSGYRDLTFNVTLARTLATGGTTPALDPSSYSGPEQRLYLTPDAVFAERSYRAPTYVWLVLGHQMAHIVVRRLLAERPELLEHGWHLRTALEPEIARAGYDAVFWHDVLEEQLASSITVHMIASPTLSWAARADAVLGTGRPLAPWFDDVFQHYAAHRDSFPTLSHLAPALAAVLDSVPLENCRGAPNPGVVLVGVDRHRAVIGWLAGDSPFRGSNLLIGDTVTTIDGDSVSGGGLLLPTRQISHAWARHLPFELGVLDIRRGGRVYSARAPITFDVRQQVRISSQAPATSDTVAVCRWNTRALRR